MPIRLDPSAVLPVEFDRQSRKQRVQSRRIGAAKDQVDVSMRGAQRNDAGESAPTSVRGAEELAHAAAGLTASSVQQALLAQANSNPQTVSSLLAS